MLKLKNILVMLLVGVITTGPVAVAVDIEALISSMTLDEKIGQMTQAERGSATANDVRDYFLGSILSAGGSVPSSNTPTGWADMHDDFQNGALSTRLGIPILYGTDAVHGHNNLIGAIFPHNIGLGATRDPDLIEEIGRITAKEVSCTGVEWTFGPCVTVPQDERWGRTYEGFGEDPELQTLLAGRYVKGLQGTTMGGESIVACAKHFAGDGGTSGGVDQGNTVCDETTLRNIHMQGYLEAIAQNVGTIMPSFSSWNGVKMHEHSYLLTDVLKTEFGFDGFLISDWEAVYQLSGASYQDDVTLMVNAGVDMGMEPSNWRGWITALRNAVNAGDISMTRIDDAVRRILRIKNRSGLFDNPLADRTLVNSGAVGSAAHRAVAREAVRKSLVLLKNNGVLPISKGSNVFVAGKNANDIGNQCGGWTITWQGSSGNTTPGTTILQGIQDAVASGGGTVTFSENGTGSTGYDVAIVVIGETPYAEGWGDDSSLSLDSTDISCLNNISAGIPTVVVMVSGRPMMISDRIGDWDAFVAAWLPGTEGNGVADVLFGDYDFTGKLPHTWPSSISQVPINIGDSGYNPLFAYGYGLNYSATTTTTTSATTTTAAGGNLALNKPATASSDEGAGYVAAYAVDGDTGTRWASAFSDPQWIYVDLGQSYNINRVLLNWEAAYGQSYQIQVSDNASSWTDIYSTTNGNGGIDDIALSGSGRYVRMYGTVPGTGYGYSLWELEVYGGGGTTTTTTAATTTTTAATTTTTSATTTTTAAGYSLPALIEAEDYTLMSGIDTETCSEGGLNVGWIDAGDWMEYADWYIPGGTYTVEYRVASSPGGGQLRLELDGGATQFPTLSVPGTDGWQNWTTISQTVTLPSGTHDIMIYAPAGGWNINWFEFTSGGTTTTTTTAATTTTTAATTTTTAATTTTTAATTTTTAATTTTTAATTTTTTAGGNLALNKAVVASSEEAGWLSADNAVDGDTGTRWGSESSDPQWIRVDLGQTYSINQVKLLWEFARGEEYKIQVANSSGGPWTDCIHITDNTTYDTWLTHNFSTQSGRYVRMYGIQRATGYGYSLWEMEVYGP